MGLGREVYKANSRYQTDLGKFVLGPRYRHLGVGIWVCHLRCSCFGAWIL